MNKFIFPLIALIVIGVFLLQKCENTPDPVLEKVRVEINRDSINSVIENQVQMKADSIIKSHEFRYENLMADYKELEKKKQRVRDRYIPQATTCDTIVVIQDEQLDSLKTALALQRWMRGQDSIKLESKDREIDSKNFTIATLSKSIKKPKRLGIGIHAGYGVTGPTVSVGINYTLIPIK